MYKIVFVDVDGTLRNNEKVITRRVKESIEKIKSLGILVVLCTGRPRNRTIHFAIESNASRYIITSGGSEVYDRETDKVIYDNIIPTELALKINQLIKKYDLMFYINSGGIRAVNHKVRLYGGEQLITNAEDFIMNNKIEQIVLNGYDADTMILVEKEIKNIPGLKIPNHSKCLDNANIPIPDLIYSDIVAETTSKGNGIKALCHYLNVKKEETIGIGDNNNDIPMFELVGLKVAMKNGIKELKDMADVIIPENSNDGVAIFLEDLYIKTKGN